jgi:hypothetical protein
VCCRAARRRCDSDRARQGPGPEAATRPPHTARTAPRLFVEMPANATAAALSAPAVMGVVAATAAIGAARSLQRVTLMRQQSCRCSGLPLSARVSICRSASAVCHQEKPAAPVEASRPPSRVPQWPVFRALASESAGCGCAAAVTVTWSRCHRHLLKSLVPCQTSPRRVPRLP